MYSVTLSKDGLQTMLNVNNSGDQSFEFQMLLHSYWRVDVSITSPSLSNGDAWVLDVEANEMM